MSERTYPYKAWVLMPSFKPVEVELIASYSGFWSKSQSFEKTATGKVYEIGTELFPNKAAAIAAGRKKIDEQQADIAKRLERINKRIAALDKAERSA